MKQPSHTLIEKIVNDFLRSSDLEFTFWHRKYHFYSKDEAGYTSGKAKEDLKNALSKVILPKEINEFYDNDENYSVLQPRIIESPSFNVLNKEGLVFRGIAETLYDCMTFNYCRLIRGHYFYEVGQSLYNRSLPAISGATFGSEDNIIKLQKSLIKRYLQNKIEHCTTHAELLSLKESILNKSSEVYKALSYHRNFLHRLFAPSTDTASIREIKELVAQMEVKLRTPSETCGIGI